MDASPVVEPALVEAFHRDGAVCVRGAFSEAELSLAETAIEANLTEPSARALVASRPGDPGRFFEDFCNWQRLPDLESDRSAYEIIGWELEPGDAVFFNMLTLHCAGGVEGPHRRRVLSLRYLGDDVAHAPRPWKTSPDFPGLADELPAGLPLDHP